MCDVRTMLMVIEMVVKKDLDRVSKSGSFFIIPRLHITRIYRQFLLVEFLELLRSYDRSSGGHQCQRLIVICSHVLFQSRTALFQVLCIGPTGTGKTLSIADKLSRNMPKEFLSEFITFSAKTSANQTQDLIDGKLDKRFVGKFQTKVCSY